MSGIRLFAILWAPGPSWREGFPLTEQPLDAHRAYFADLHTRGEVVIAGPFIDEASGGMALIRAASRDDATATMAADPAVVTGVFKGVVRPFYAVFGADGSA